MKKLLLIFLFTLILSACADKNQYQEAVLVEMQKEQDIKDYEINPEHITDCIVDLSSKKMLGVFPFDPARMMAYRNYTTMLTLTQSVDPKETLAKLIKDFGSAKDLLNARINYSESISTCIASMITSTEPEGKENS